MTNWKLVFLFKCMSLGGFLPKKTAFLKVESFVSSPSSVQISRNSSVSSLEMDFHVSLEDKGFSLILSSNYHYDDIRNVLFNER
jgi:hypothetical protein